MRRLARNRCTLRSKQQRAPADISYALTQFEATAARKAFP